ANKTDRIKLESCKDSYGIGFRTRVVSSPGGRDELRCARYSSRDGSRVPGPRSGWCAASRGGSPDRLGRWSSASRKPTHTHGPGALVASRDCTPASPGTYAGSGPGYHAADNLPCPTAACHPDE